MKLVRTDMPMDVTVMNTVFWVVVPCTSVELCHNFGEAARCMQIWKAVQ